MKNDINRHDFLKIIGGTGVLLSNCSVHAASSKPNIIYIMLDEWGYYELSCLGHPQLKTPFTDKMVREGMRFTQCLAGAAVCAPTRSALMQGLHTGHSTIRGNSGDYASLCADDFTVAEMLKKAGYVTGGFGKWGLGSRGTSGIPEKHGFDTFFGYYGQKHAHTYFPEYLIHNSKEVLLEGNEGYCYEGKIFSHNVIYEKTIEFIKKNKNRPFFCYCPWTPPHGSWGFDKTDPSWKLFKDKPWNHGEKTNEDARVYAAMLSMVDRQLGEIIALLKELGLDEKTIIFFCGDNGGADYFNEKDHPKDHYGVNKGYPRGFFRANVDPRTGKEFRGRKNQFYEGGIRIPLQQTTSF